MLNRWWTSAIILLLIVVGASLALFVYRATTEIREALAEEVLQQQRDVATLLYDFSSVMLAIERQRRTPGGESLHMTNLAIDVALSQLEKMRSEYSFARLDGAAKAHAYVKPVLEDIEQWFKTGLPGFEADDKMMLAVVSQRANDRYPGLRDIAAETDAVAQSLIMQQTRDLDSFRDSSLLILGAFALLTGTIVALLTRQRNLQIQLSADQESQSSAVIIAETRGRERAEMALRGSEKILRETLDALPSAIAILNQIGIIVAANIPWKRFVTDSGSPFDNGGIGKVILDVYRSTGVSDVAGSTDAADSIREVVSGNRASLDDEFPIIQGDIHRWVAVSAKTLDIIGERHTVLIHNDITERKRFEDRDRRLRAELTQVSMLTTAAEMASGLAHELNQPLTAISHDCHSALASVRETIPVDSELQDIINDIHEQSQRAGQIVRSLRQLARHEHGDFERTNINELVEETVRLTESEALEKGVDVQLRLADNLPFPLADAVQIRQVLVNLQRNSVEVLGQNNCAIRSLVVATALNQGKSIRVSVHDTGPGLTPDIKDRLFVAFQTTKTGGMGLGLSISRSIVEAHGGHLWIDQGVDSGTTFHFTLPLEERVL